MSSKAKDSAEVQAERPSKRSGGISHHGILITGFAVLIALEVVPMVMTGAAPAASAVIRLLLTIMLMWAVVKGKTWARILMSVLLILGGAVGLLAIGELSRQGLMGMSLIAAAVFYVGFGLYLLLGPDRRPEAA